MNELSSVGIALLCQDLSRLAQAIGFSVVLSQELNPEDPETAYAATVMSPQREWSAKFMGKTQTASIRGAMDYVKRNGEYYQQAVSVQLPSPPQGPQQE